MSTITRRRSRAVSTRITTVATLRKGDRFTIGDGTWFRLTHPSRELSDGRLLLRYQNLTAKGRPFGSFRQSPVSSVLRQV